MENMTIEKTIENLLNRILDESIVIDGKVYGEVWLDEENKAALRQFLYFCINSEKTGETIPYNILIETFDQEKGNVLANKMAFIGSSLLRCKHSWYTEDEFNRNILENVEKNASISVISNMMKDIPENWDQIFKCLRLNNKKIKIYVKDDENNSRLEDDSFFRWRFLNLHMKKTHMSSNDAYEYLIKMLHGKEYDLTDEFISGMSTYIETVYPKAKTQEEEFVLDAIQAVEQRMMSTGIAEKRLLEKDIPLYSKNIAFSDDEKQDGLFEESVVIENTPMENIEDNESEHVATDNGNGIPNENIKTIDEYIEDYYTSSQTTVNHFEGEKIINKPDEIRVLVFPLSTFPYDSKTKQNLCHQNTLELLGYNEKYYYFYQLEPIFIQLKKKMQNGQIDYIVIAVTDKTITDAKSECRFVSDVSTYEIPLSPFEFVSRLASEIRLLNEDEENAKLINEKISSYITPEHIRNERKNLRIIPVQVEQDKKIEKSISNILNILKTIKKEEQKKLVVEYDNHGGSRDAQMVLESIMSLIENDKEITINKYSICGGGNSFVLKDTDFGPIKFVAGITEFRKYGKTQTLREFYPSNKISKEEDSFIKTLEHISMGIQFNDQEVFSNGLEDLKNINILKIPEGSYLRLFGNEILDDYRFVSLESKLDYLIGMIKWCSEKGYFQQCLSIIESIVPYVLAESGIFHNEISDETKLERLTNNTKAKKKGKNEEINTYVFNNVFMHSPYLNALKALKKGNDNPIKINEIINECKKNYKGTGIYKPHDNFNQNFSLATFDNKYSIAFLDKHKELKEIRNNSNHPREAIGSSGKYNSDWLTIEKIKVGINDYISKLTKLPPKAIEIIYN